MDITKNKFLSKNYLYILLLSIIAFGIFLRFYNLSIQPYWMDEGYTINAITSILEKGNTVLDSGQNYSCPLYCYPTSLMAKLFGQNPFSYRFLSALAGILLIIVIYPITKKIINKNTAVLTTIFISLSYWQIAWSRQARWYTLFSLFTLVSIYFFHSYLNQKNKKLLNLSLSLFFLALSVITHKLGYLLLFSYILWLITNAFINKNQKLKLLYLSSLLGVMLVFFEYVLDFNFISTAFSKINLGYALPYYLNFYLRNYWMFIIFAIILFLTEKNNKKTYIYLIFIFAVNLSALSFFSNIVHYRYLFHLTPILFILGSAGIIEVINNIKSSRNKYILITMVIFIFIISGQGIVWPKKFYTLESDNPKYLNRPYYAYTPQPDFNKAYAHIKENIKNDDIIISSHPQFNKIFLQTPGYWIKYNYRGVDESDYGTDKEYYVNAKIINNINEIKNLTELAHGYIVLDYMSIDNRIPMEIYDYINNNSTLVFYDEINIFSKIWVYKF